MYDSLDTWYCMLLNMAEITEVELITFSKPDRKKRPKKIERDEWYYSMTQLRNVKLGIMSRKDVSKRNFKYWGWYYQVSLNKPGIQQVYLGEQM